MITAVANALVTVPLEVVIIMVKQHLCLFKYPSPARDGVTLLMSKLNCCSSNGCAIGACPSAGFQQVANHKKMDFYGWRLCGNAYRTAYNDEGGISKYTNLRNYPIQHDFSFIRSRTLLLPGSIPYNLTYLENQYGRNGIGTSLNWKCTPTKVGSNNYNSALVCFKEKIVFLL